MRRTQFLLALAVPASLMTASPVEARGCVKGAVIGGVAGHFMHHHAVAGAAVGCVAGHYVFRHRSHRYHHYRRYR